MPFSVSWHTLLDEADDLAGDATLVTPLSHKEFRITDTQEHRIIIEYTDRDRDEKRPIKRDQFETLYHRIQDAPETRSTLTDFPPMLIHILLSCPSIPASRSMRSIA
jgi:hypothetical protein